MPKFKLSLRLSDAKVALQLAQEGLKGVGIPGVEAIAGVPLRLIEYYETLTDNKGEMDQLAATLESLQRIIIEPLEAAPHRGHEHVPGLRQRVDKLNETLLEMQSRVEGFGPLSRWASLRRKDEISAVLKDINRDLGRAITRFQLGGQITMELKLWHLEAERLLSTLHPAKARFDASDKRPCLPNTRSTLLDTLHDHIRNSPRTFICLYGSPGTGKSAVAKSIAAELHRNGLLSASYFFDKRGGSAGNISLGTFVSTLVYQLARFNFDFYVALCAQLENDPLLVDAHEEIRLRELLLEPLRTVFSFRPPRRRWIIVLDALDECGDVDHHRRLMELIRSCAVLSDHLLFFLTCRPEAEITRVIEGWTMGPYAAIESIDEQDQEGTTGDIRAYIEDQLLKIKESEGWRFMPSAGDISRLAALCGGLFEIAAIRLRELLKDARSRPLRRAFPDALQAAEHSAFALSPLHATYLAILTSAFESSDHPERRSYMLRLHHILVGALTALHQPLAIGPLSALVGIEQDDASKCLEPLRAVIAVPDNDEPVHAYHASFLEFLLSETARDTPAYSSEYFISSMRSHTVLAKQCLLVMNGSLRRNILCLPDVSVMNVTIPDLPLAIALQIPKHLQYACLWWTDHLSRDAVECCDLFLEWCDRDIIFYLEVISLLGEFEKALLNLKAAENWITETGKVGPSATILSDCQHLVRMFYPAISKCAGTLYSSALPFMPPCDLLTRYRHLASLHVEFPNGRLEAWPAHLWTQSLPGSNDSGCAAFSPDGRHLVCVTKQQQTRARIFSVATGGVEQVLRGPSNLVTAIAFSPDGALIASGSSDGSVRLWSACTGAQKQVLAGHTSLVNSVAFSPNGGHVLSGSDDRSVRVWSTATGRQERLLKGHASEIVCVSFSADGACIFSGSGDSFVRTWDAATGALLQSRWGRFGERADNCDDDRFKYATPWVSGDGSDNGDADQSDDRSDEEDESDTSSCSSTTSGPNAPNLPQTLSEKFAVAVTDDGVYAASSAIGNSVRIWFITTGKRHRSLRGHTGWVRSIAFSRDSSLIASGADDRSVRVWSVATGSVRHVFEGHAKPLKSVAISPDGEHIVSVSRDLSLRVWSAANKPQRLAGSDGRGRQLRSVVFSSDGGHIAILDSAQGARSHRAHVWSVASGVPKQVFEVQDVLCAAFSPDAAHIVIGHRNRSLCIWSLAARRERKLARWAPLGRLASTAFSPDGARIACASSDWSVAVWSTVTGTLACSISGQLCRPAPTKIRDIAPSVQFSLDGQVLRLSRPNIPTVFLQVDLDIVIAREPISSLRFPSQPGTRRPAPAHGWLDVEGTTLWVPQHLEGKWWTQHGVAVVEARDRKGRFVIFKIPSKHRSD